VLSARIVPRQHFQQQGGAVDVVGKRADLIERAAVGNQAEAGHPAITGLEADNAAQGRGPDEWSRRYRYDGERGQTAGHRRPEPPLDRARNARDVPRLRVTW